MDRKLKGFIEDLKRDISRLDKGISVDNLEKIKNKRRINDGN